MKPYSLAWITLTFGLSLLLSIVVLPEAIRPWRPDWVVMNLIFWCLVRPDRVGIGSAFAVGIIQDALSASLLGQHALGLILVAYLTLSWQPRLHRLPPWQQVWVVFLLLLAYRLVLMWVLSVVNQTPHTGGYWLPVLSGMLLWPWFYWLQRAQLPKA